MAAQYIDRDELKVLWRMLERLQADVIPESGEYVWRESERDALVIVMNAVKDSQMPSLTDAQKAEIQRRPRSDS
jgi:hypothetical protein